MSYVDAIHVHNRDQGKIMAVERINGKRKFVEYPANYTFYFNDPKGHHKTLFGTNVSKFSTNSFGQFNKNLKMHKEEDLWESDLNPIFQCLSKNYVGVEAPKLHTAFFDIEVDFDRERGYAPTTDPFNKITAITVYLDWMDKLITLVIPPNGWTDAQIQAAISPFSDTYVFDREEDMLETFIDLVDDADILSGWNSEGYDIPYTINRIIKILSVSHTTKLCLWNEKPRKRVFERYGTEQSTYDLVGRVHLDYMQLYIKYTYEERQSYSLDYISDFELGEKKVEYEGSLDQLYNKDFSKFVDYNRQDVMLLAKLDKKLKYIDLANLIAHENTVLLQTTMGSVAVIEQGVINDAHSKGLVVPNRKRHDSADTKAAGAWVANPKKGIHEWIGSVDINSLYPSTIRALNMSPETILGQITPKYTDDFLEDRIARSKKKMSFAAAWEGLFSTKEYELVMKKDMQTPLEVVWEHGEVNAMTGADIYRLVFNDESDMVLSANGTIFIKSKVGIIPQMLETWYADRKRLQGIMKKFINLDIGIDLIEKFGDIPDHNVNFTEVGTGRLKYLDIKTIDKIIESGSLEELIKFVEDSDLCIIDGKLKPNNKKDIEEAIEYWDKRQHVKKILLNSAYGSLLNIGCRFFDKRIGQSTTLSGRSITKSMAETVNECICGVRDHEGEAVVYGDTDSNYFSAWPIIKNDVESGKLIWNKESAIQLYDEIAVQINEFFPGFMRRAFNCDENRGKIIRAGREIVASRGLFIKKKRYAVMYYDKEGKRKDTNGKEGEIKAMGLDLKRADTPKIVQVFLMEILSDLLHNEPKTTIDQKIKEFKHLFINLPPWEKGTPKRVNNLTEYGKKVNKTNSAGNKIMIPGHVMGALNWNNLLDIHSDKSSMRIVDGMKIVVCKLKQNPIGYDCVAYPIDQKKIPDWFKELPFDDEAMEEAVVDQKIKNLLGVLNWNIVEMTNTKNNFSDLFAQED